MRNCITIALALAAGFLGGLASRYRAPVEVHAQTPPSPPAEIRAQKFVLVDQNGEARGVFGFETTGAPVIEINDQKGHVFTTRWYGGFHNPPFGPDKPTLLR
jgi:hypothetical protein